MTKIKFIDLDEFYSFVVDNVYIWNHLRAKNSVQNPHILKINFSIVQIKSDGEKNRTKLVYLDKFYNCVNGDFSIWNNLRVQNSIYFPKLR